MSTTREARTKGSSIARVLEIVEAVSQAGRPPSPGDLAALLDIPKPSVHRLLQQLQADGYVQTDLRGLVVPGERLVAMARGVLHTSRHKAFRQAILRRLSAEVEETCGISIPDGVEMIYFDRVTSNWPIQIHLPIGSHAPTWCTASGKLYLSSFPRQRRRELLHKLPLTRMTRRTITDPEALDAELERIRENGLGIDDEEFVAGMIACAVPIRDRDGRDFAYLYVHAPTLRMSVERLRGYVPSMRRAAAELAGLADSDGD